jgi:hypothetical protein
VVRLLAQDPDVCTFVVEGEASAIQFRDAYSSLMSMPPRLTLFDLTAATAGQVDVDDVLDLGRRLVEIGRQRLVVSKAALVCSREPDYSVLRAFLTAVPLERSPVRFAIFATRESARAWLTAGEGVA